VLLGTLAGGLLAAPLVAEAQQAAKVFRVGLLGTVPVTEPGAARMWGGLFEGLRKLGYVDGQNIVYDGRFSEGSAATAAHAAKGATAKIPSVVPNYGEPVEDGLVASLARPGGNVTGLAGPNLVAKQLQLLKEALPTLSPFASRSPAPLARGDGRGRILESPIAYLGGTRSDPAGRRHLRRGH
jgi:putative ABC transport system substrate-binding protein